VATLATIQACLSVARDVHGTRLD